MSAQAEIKEAVRVAGTLLSGWRRTSDDTDPDWELTTNEINSYVRSARESLVTLEEGMAIIRSHRRKFKLTEAEVSSREAFIESTRRELEAITAELLASRAERETHHEANHSGFRELSPSSTSMSAYPPQSGDIESERYDFAPRSGEEGITIHVAGMVPGSSQWGDEEEGGEERRPGEEPWGTACRWLGPPCGIVAVVLLCYILFSLLPIWSSRDPDR